MRMMSSRLFKGAQDTPGCRCEQREGAVFISFLQHGKSHLPSPHPATNKRKKKKRHTKRWEKNGEQSQLSDHFSKKRKSSQGRGHIGWEPGKVFAEDFTLSLYNVMKMSLRMGSLQPCSNSLARPPQLQKRRQFPVDW